MLTLRNVTHAFGDTPILHGVNLTVEEGEILCLLGPSGCGKTTILRLIAGLESLQQGDILFQGHSIVNVPVHRRRFGLMFQEFALFPHLNVLENVIFGLKVRGLPRNQLLSRGSKALSVVRLEGYDEREVSQLSGGERQRVALARSIAPEPDLLMLDEPLGSLDAHLRDHLLVELRRIIKTLGLTALYVTHDQYEAYAVADRIAIMNMGHMEQVDTPMQIYRYPRTEFIARFLNMENIVPVETIVDNCACTPIGKIMTTGRPKSILLHPQGIQMTNQVDASTIKGRITERRFQGDRFQFLLLHDSGVQLKFYVDSRHAQLPSIGDTISVICLTEFTIPLNN